jgi:pimeloyl-ACP methyl ester carboxylesterase
MTDEVDAAVARRLSEVVDRLALADPPSLQKQATTGSVRRRRGFVKEDYTALATLSLVRQKALSADRDDSAKDQGTVYRWVYRPPIRGNSARRARRAAAAPPIGAEVVKSFSFEEVPPNEIIAKLENLDKGLTPDQGLRRFNVKTGKLEPAEGVSIKGRVLLLVHGTFSKSDMFVDELNLIKTGKAFLGRAGTKYEAILSFDHPTLSVSPWINALDLELALTGVTGPIDVVCHSRGGLVVGWWLRNAKRQVENVIFVGAPLEGTSLASPANLRAALQGLANVFKGLEAAGSLASTVVPLVSVVAGLSKIFGGILQLGASTPLLDVAVISVPGLAGQSRVGNNAELLRLNRAQWISTPTIHAVISNFAPDETDAAWWQVWKLLSNPGQRIVNWGADAIFKDKNDLVVDTKSMNLLCGKAIDIGRIHDFGDSPNVHHCNYFQQNETVTLLTKALKL